MTPRPVLCIVGLGYVGLPLAHAFASKQYRVIGFDVSRSRIDTLKQGNDWTNELTPEQLKNVSIEFTEDASSIQEADVVILAIPTPVDTSNRPDLTLLEKASETVGKNLKKGAIVVYESTVYPGVTEDICGPILEKHSGLVSGKDFTLGYSPERINPGDKQHTVTKIKKIVSGQDEKTLRALADLYGSVVEAGIHNAPSIKVAEMAKAIENAQRDLNIAYMNEIAMLCNRIGIRTEDVLDAAKTKWNFLPFSPGLVGGHCIGVDPYYLVEKAMELGMTTHIISAGRAINDGMSAFVVGQVLEKLGRDPQGAKALVLGLTFKEDVPDTRNSKVKDVVSLLKTHGMDVRAHDPLFGKEDIEKMGYAFGTLDDGPYDAVLLLVPHKEYRALAAKALTSAVTEGGVLYDLKSLLDPATIRGEGRSYLSL